MDPDDIINPSEPDQYGSLGALSAGDVLLEALEDIRAVEERGGHVDIVGVVYNVDHGEIGTTAGFVRGLPYGWMRGAFLRRCADVFDEADEEACASP